VCRYLGVITTDEKEPLPSWRWGAIGRLLGAAVFGGLAVLAARAALPRQESDTGPFIWLMVCFILNAGAAASQVVNIFQPTRKNRLIAFCLGSLAVAYILISFAVIAAALDNQGG
jgi:hypothetical protein